MSNSRGSACLTLLLVLAFASMWLSPVNAAIINVDDDGVEYPGSIYTTIQEGINAASDSDTVVVYAGTYAENVLVDKSITLTGIGDPVIDARWIGDAVTITADGCTVEGLTIISGGEINTGINVQSNDNTIRGNTINYFGTSIKLVSVSGNTVTQNTLQYCLGHGIYLEESDDNTITENIVTDYVFEGIHYPIYVTQSSGNVIHSNTLDFGLGDFEVFVTDAYDDSVSNTWYNTETNRGNQYGDYTGVDDDEDGVGDTPYYIDPYGGGAVDPYPLVSTTPEAPTISGISASARAVQAKITWMTDQANSDHRVYYWSVGEYDDGQWSDWVNGTDTPSIKIEGLFTDTTCYYRCYSYRGDDDNYFSSSDVYSFDTWERESITITVDDDGVDYPDPDYNTIQDAVDAAQDEDTIQVYPGLYTEKIVVEKTLFFKGVDFPVLNGSVGVIMHLKKANSIIEGFSFNSTFERTGGGYEPKRPAVDNAGIWTGYTVMVGSIPFHVGAGNATVFNCKFNNTYYGIYIGSESDVVTVSECHFNQRASPLTLPPLGFPAASIRVHNSDEVTITDSFFNPWGWGVYVYLSEYTIIDQCDFAGLGVYIQNSRSNQVTGSLFNDDRGNNVVTVSQSAYGLSGGAPYNNYQWNMISGNTFNNSCIKIDDGVTDAVIQDNVLFIDRPTTILSGTPFLYVKPGCERITVQGNTVTGTGFYSLWDTVGIRLHGKDCDLTGNTVTLMNKGIQVENCEGLTMRGNDMHDNIYNFYFANTHYAYAARYFNNDVDTSNTVDGKEIEYIVGESGLTIEPSSYPDAGMLILVNCSDVTVRNQLFQKNSYGVLLYNSNGTTIEGVTCVLNREAGIALYRSEDVTMEDCTTKNNGLGLYVHRARELAVSGCIVENNDQTGIEASYLFESAFTGNTVEDNGQDSGYGVHLRYYSTQNTFHTNTIRSTIEDRQKYGIFTTSYSEGNLFYNNHLENEVNAKDNGLTQTWNTAKTLGTNIIDGPYLAGNYWSDYELIGGDNNHDGIGDTHVPWTTGGNISPGDHMPLTKVTIPDTVPPTMTITSPVNDATYTSSVVQLRASSPDPDVAAWWYNLNGGPDVAFTPNTVITGLANGEYTLVVHVKDTSDNENHETIAFTVTISSGGGYYMPPQPPLPEVPQGESNFTITITSPKTASYTERTVTLTYTSPRPLSRVSCIVDGGAPVELKDSSFTLDRLTLGEHTIIVSGEDYYGELGRGEVTFNVVPLTLEGDTHARSGDYPDEAVYYFTARPTNYTLTFQARGLSRGEVSLYLNSYLEGEMGGSPAITGLFGNVTLLGILEPASTWRAYNYTVDVRDLVIGADNYVGFIHGINPGRLSGLDSWEVRDVVLTPVSLVNVPMIQVTCPRNVLSLRDELYPTLLIDGVEDPGLYDAYLYIVGPDGGQSYYPDWGAEAKPLDSKLLGGNYYGRLSQPYVFGPAAEPGTYSLVAKITSKGGSSLLALSMSRVYYSNSSSVKLYINKEAFTEGDTVLVEVAVTPPLNTTHGSLVVQLEDPKGRAAYLPGQSGSTVRIPLSPLKCSYLNLLESPVTGSWSNGTYVLRARLYGADGDLLADDTQLFTVSQGRASLGGVISLTSLASTQVTSKSLRLLDAGTLRTVASISEGAGPTYSLSAPPGQYFLVGEVVAGFLMSDTLTWDHGYVFSVGPTRVALYPGEDTVYNLKLYKSLGKIAPTTTPVIHWGQGPDLTPAFYVWTGPYPQQFEVNNPSPGSCTPNVYASVSISDGVMSEVLAENPGDDDATVKRFYSLRAQGMLKAQSTDVQVSSYGEIQDALRQQEQMLLEGQITEVSTDLIAGISGEYMVALSLNKLGERYLASAVLYDLDLVTVAARTSNEAATLDQALNAAVSALGDLGAFIRQWEVTHPVPPRNPTLTGTATPDNVSPEEDQNKATVSVSLTNCWDEPVKGAKVYFTEVTDRGYLKGVQSQGVYSGSVYTVTDPSGVAAAEYTLNKGMQAGQDRVDYLVEARGRRTVKASTIIKVNGLAMDVKAVNTTLAPYETTTIHVDVYRINKDGSRTPREGAAILIESGGLRDSKVIPLGRLNEDGMPVTDANGRASFRFTAGAKEGVVDVAARYQALSYEDSIRGVVSVEVKAEKYLITVRWTETVDKWVQEADYGLLSQVGRGCRVDGLEWNGKYTYTMEAQILWDARSGREETDVTLRFEKDFISEYITHVWWPAYVGDEIRAAHSVTTTRSSGEYSITANMDDKVTVKTKLMRDAAGNLYIYLNPIRIDVPLHGSYSAHEDRFYFEEMDTGQYDSDMNLIFAQTDSSSSSRDYSHVYDGTTYRPNPPHYADAIIRAGNPKAQITSAGVFPGEGFSPILVLSKSGSGYTPYRQSFHVDYSTRLYPHGFKSIYLLPGEYDSVFHGPDDFYWTYTASMGSYSYPGRVEPPYRYHIRSTVDREFSLTVVRK